MFNLRHVHQDAAGADGVEGVVREERGKEILLLEMDHVCIPHTRRSLKLSQDGIQKSTPSTSQSHLGEAGWHSIVTLAAHIQA